jgi:hypothetical protein
MWHTCIRGGDIDGVALRAGLRWTRLGKTDGPVIRQDDVRVAVMVDDVLRGDAADRLRTEVVR